MQLKCHTKISMILENYKSNGKDTTYPLIADISVVQFQKSITEISFMICFMIDTSFYDSEV